MISRRAWLGALGMSGAVVLAAVAACSSWFAPVQAPAPPAAGYTDSVLTATLEVATGTVVRDTRFVWAGPPGVPMLRLTGTFFAQLDHLAFEVPAGRHATAAVELVNGAGGGPLGNSLANLQIGSPARSSNLDYGILWTGQVNGDSNTLTNVAVFGAGTAGVSVNNPQATGNSLRGLFVFDSPVGLQTAAGGSIICDNCGFIGSTDVDVELTGGAGLLMTGLYSEGSRSFARITGGPGGGGLSVTGGYWQHGPKAIGPTITGLQMCCYRSWLRLTDFMVTPVGPAPTGSVVGVPGGQQFVSNVAGIAG